MSKHKPLVFTDLDGSLLNHYNYSYDAAIPLLQSLEQQQIPVIASTSKTRAELIPLRKKLNNHHPFIAENGAAVYIPAGYFSHRPEGTFLQDNYWVKAFVEPRGHWQQLLAQLEPRLLAAYESFSYMGVKGIMRSTGLSNIDATRASLREYGEPIEWHSNSQLKQEFIATMNKAGAGVLEGGRFMHISGHCNKGNAMQWLTAQFQQATTSTLVTIAIGDSDNDVAMLNIADYAITVKAPSKPFPVLNPIGTLIKTKAIAPEGWVEGVSQAIQLSAINKY